MARRASTLTSQGHRQSAVRRARTYSLWPLVGSELAGAIARRVRTSEASVWLPVFRPERSPTSDLR